MASFYKTKNYQAKKYQTKKFNDPGFSLIELLVVILMIGILSAIAAPGWLGFINRQRLNKANDAVYSALKAAQSEAKARKLSYSASFQVNNNVIEYAIHPATDTPSEWISLGSTIGLKSRQVFFYSNLTNVTGKYNTATTDKKVVLTAPTSSKVTFDYLGILANQSGNTAPDIPLKVMVAPPVSGGTAAGGLKRCVIIEGLIGGMRLAKDAACTL